MYAYSEYIKFMENNYVVIRSRKNGYILLTFSLRTTLEIVLQMLRKYSSPSFDRRSLQVPCIRACQKSLPFQTTCRQRTQMLLNFFVCLLSI